MSRNLKSSEKLLLGACFLLVVGIGGAILSHQYNSRATAAREKIAKLEDDLAGRTAAAGDREFWERREAWLDANMPDMGDAGTAQSELLEFVQSTAQERQLELSSPALLKPEGGASHHELAVSVRAVGSDLAVLRWLAEMQSPEKFIFLKTLSLTPDRWRGRPVTICTATIAQWYRK
ncbi:hypothetical protein BH23VER1_BH23VER1_34380 [soil metagenome]